MSEPVITTVPTASVLPAAQQHLHHLIESTNDAATLLVLSGGSAIQLYPVITQLIVAGKADHLVLSQVDERYGPIDHDHSNAKEIEIATSLISLAHQHGIETRLMLTGKEDRDEEVHAYAAWLRKAVAICPHRLAVLGIGQDAHIAGMLPTREDQFSALFQSEHLVVGYDSPDQYRQRITLTMTGLAQMTSSLVMAVSDSKRQAIDLALRQQPAPRLHQAPAAILRTLSQVHVFTDQ